MVGMNMRVDKNGDMNMRVNMNGGYEYEGK